MVSPTKEPVMIFISVVQILANAALVVNVHTRRQYGRVERSTVFRYVSLNNNRGYFANPCSNYGKQFGFHMIW